MISDEGRGEICRSLAFSNSKWLHTHANTHTHTSAEADPGGVFFSAPTTFQILGTLLRLVPELRMSHWRSQRATVTAGALEIAAECHSGRGLGALYSLYAKVLTPCVGPLTPHLMPSLMWLY